MIADEQYIVPGTGDEDGMRDPQHIDCELTLRLDPGGVVFHKRREVVP